MKPVSVPLRPPQISHGLAWDRKGASAVTDREEPPDGFNLI
jgi:hypothetical protein